MVLLFLRIRDCVSVLNFFLSRCKNESVRLEDRMLTRIFGVIVEMFDEGPQLPSDADGDEQDPLYFGKTASEEKLNNNILDGTATYIMYRPS